MDSFARFLGGVSVPVSEFDGELIGEWVSYMFSNNYSYKTVGYYVNILSSLYGKVAKDEGVERNGCFRTIKEKLNNASSISLEINSVPDCLGKVRRLVLADCSRNPMRQLAKDIVLFSLYNGGLTFDKIAKYRKEDYLGDDEAILSIVSRYSKPKNKYLFPLNPSERTPNQLDKFISLLFSEALGFVGINLSAYNSATALDLWAIIAMRCGFSASVVAGCLGDASSMNPLYSFAVRKNLTPERKVEIRNRVTQILARDPEDWYAMQFRPYVDYDKVMVRLSTLGISFAKSFYPMNEIVRRVGKKIKREYRPVILGLFFFKSKAADLPELFNQIGDLAWGYRYSKNVRSPYAVIPQKSIEDYEKAVSQFIDCIDTYPEGSLNLKEGDKVEITGGEFSGHPAIFEKEIRKITKGSKVMTRITNRLRLAGIESCTWTVELDPRQVAKISDERFETLRRTI